MLLLCTMDTISPAAKLTWKETWIALSDCLCIGGGRGQCIWLLGQAEELFVHVVTCSWV